MADTLTLETYNNINRALKELFPKKAGRPYTSQIIKKLALRPSERQQVSFSFEEMPSFERIRRALWQGKCVRLNFSAEESRFALLWVNRKGALQERQENLTWRENTKLNYILSLLEFNADHETRYYNDFSTHGWHTVNLTPEESDAAPTYYDGRVVAIRIPSTDDCGLPFFQNGSKRGDRIQFESPMDGTRGMELVFENGNTLRVEASFTMQFALGKNTVSIEPLPHASPEVRVPVITGDMRFPLHQASWLYQPIVRLLAPHLRSVNFINPSDTLTEMAVERDWVFSGQDNPLFPEDKDVNKLSEILSDISSSKASEASEISYEPVTDGVCAEGEMGFGLEIEFEVSRSAFSRNSVRSEIARRLYEENLAWDGEYKDWHWNGRYAPEPYAKWSVEHDSTVAGEVISPILYDTPETWKDVEKVLTIIREAGGIVKESCGQHIHMGIIRRNQLASPSLVTKRQAAVMHLYAAYEDSIRRVQADPARKTHRGGRYSAPLSSDSISRVQDKLKELVEYNNLLGGDHGTALNMGFSNRVEFRGADGSLDYRHIRANVAVAAAIIGKAQTVESLPELPPVQGVGYNALRQKAIEKTSLTEEQKEVACELGFAHFVHDLLKDNQEGYREVVYVGSRNPWQEPYMSDLTDSLAYHEG